MTAIGPLIEILKSIGEYLWKNRDSLKGLNPAQIRKKVADGLQREDVVPDKALQDFAEAEDAVTDFKDQFR